MLIEALTWWAEQMAGLLPGWLLTRRSAWDSALIVAAAEKPGAPATVWSRRNGRETPLGPLQDDDRSPPLNGHSGRQTILLRPPRGALLEKQMTLPLAAARDLRRVMGYEINRVTPFEPDDVFWDCAVTRYDRGRKRLQVRLSLVPKTALAPVLAALEAAGMTPTALEAIPAAGPPRLIPLRQETERIAWRRRVTIRLAGACATLAVVAAALPFLMQSLALQAAANRIAAVQPQVTEVQALRQRIAAASAGQGAIADERRRLGDSLEVLAAVTQLLPDDTFLTDLSLRQRRLAITGQSASAPKLIAGLAADPMFRNPGFSAPVTRNVAADRDIFSINAGVGP